MAMTQAILKILSQEKPDPKFHDPLLSKVKALANKSRNRMSNYFPAWDSADDTFRRKVKEDDKDRKAKQRNEPVKGMVPLSYSQMLTFVCFMFLLFKQRPKFFELTARAPEDEDSKKDCENILQKDLDHSQFDQHLFQFLLDLVRFGIGIYKHRWTKETRRVKIPGEVVETEVEQDGHKVTQAVEGDPEIQHLTAFHGNEVSTVSPYRFLPDPDYPLTDFQKGNFCGSEEEFSMASLKTMQMSGEVTGIDWLKAMDCEMFKDRGGAMSNRNYFTSVFPSNGFMDPNVQKNGGRGADSSPVLVTEMYVWLVPNDFQDANGNKVLGTETESIRYLVRYANDSRIIQFEEWPQPFRNFPYEVGQFLCDKHKFINEGLADVISWMQSLVTWLLNAHVTSVRKNIDNKVVCDPAMVELDDLRERRPVIRLKPNALASGASIDRFIHQMTITDVTQGHVMDANSLMGLTSMVTGVNENSMGRYHSGRRSSYESRVVNGGASSRMKVVAMLIDSCAHQPLGKAMLATARMALDEQSFLRTVGKDVDPQRFITFHSTMEDIITGDDFAALDTTLPTERMSIAGSLQELVIALISNPIAAQTLPYDVKKIWEKMLEYQGVTNPDSFLATTPEQLSPLLMQVLMQQQAGGQGQPQQSQTQPQPQAA